VRKRAKVKRVVPLEVREDADGGQGGERGGELGEGSRRHEGSSMPNGGRESGGAKGNYPKTRYLDWTPWGARR